MSSLWLNWRVGGWFLQVERPAMFVRWARGEVIGRPWRLERLPKRPRAGESWVSIYQGRVPFALLLMALVLVVLQVASCA